MKFLCFYFFECPDRGLVPRESLSQAACPTFRSIFQCFHNVPRQGMMAVFLVLWHQPITLLPTTDQPLDSNNSHGGVVGTALALSPGRWKQLTGTSIVVKCKARRTCKDYMHSTGIYFITREQNTIIS